MTQVVQSVDRALGLLWLVQEQSGRSLTELAARAGLIPSTTLRLLATLQKHGLVMKDHQGHYRLGAGVLRLQQGRRDHDIAALLEDEVRALARQVGEQVSLAMLLDQAAVHVLAVDGASETGKEVLLRSFLYRRDANVNATALGKVLLATAPSARADAVIAQLSWTKTAAQTITDPDELRAHLEMVRQQGYATSIHENTDGASGIAVPVASGDDDLVLGLAVHGPLSRLGHARLLEVLPLLQSAATDCERRLGVAPATNGVAVQT